MDELKVTALSKIYQDGKKALDDFSFAFTEGIYGILGPNGAGKSTLIHLLTDQFSPSGGIIAYQGNDVRKQGQEYRRVLGYMPQQQELYPDFTLQRFLSYMAALKGLDKKTASEQIPYLMKRVNLYDYRRQRLGTFSGGMQQRALIAQALLGKPEILILDEPTAGLDPQERIRIRNLISEIAFHRIVLIATHVVSDVEFIAKEILLMKQGKIVTHQSPEVLCENIRGKVYEAQCTEEDWKAVSRRYTISNLSQNSGRIKVRMLSEQKPEEVDVETVVPSLEDVYLYYFGEESAYES